MTLARLARIAVQTGRLRCEVGAHARRRRRARKQCMMQRPRQVRLSPTMECIFEYPFVRMSSLCPWITACKYYALQQKTQTERQTRETVGWRAFTRGKCIFPRSDAFTAARSLLWRPMRRGERVLIFASSLSSNAKWIPHMHPLLEADAYCYSTFREAFLSLRSRMRPLLEIA